ncbi:family 78 glycoside hydrolase catalytic domain [Nocardioides sp. SYSU D00038]|uniref:family 78 glycoside hydrolase catalytic domain n=1 Tax=Nocardioides sp. SYSU D00038 TaxID=2812554 RepID=UPI00196753E4|nr:family 78 glycoside hydrolase catalytic domain [Nocardioides sp. SYSU D00038]
MKRFTTQATLLAALGAALAGAPTAHGSPATDTPPAVAAGASASTAGLTLGDLTVEHRANPLGIDADRPRFGWVLGSTAQGATQSAYQLQVSTTADGAGDVWDSGKVGSTRSFDVEYDGPALDSRTRYHWRVRVWDAAEQASAWSAPAWFETAFLDEEEFGGAWIGGRSERVSTDLQGASWIWYPQGNPADSAPVGTRYFRRTIDLPQDAEVTKATFQLTADDSFVLHVNGTVVGRSPQVAESWRTAVDVDVTAELRPGRNVIAVRATNTQPGPSGLVGKLRLELADGTQPDLVTDASWKAHDTEVAGWEQVDFDDSAWPTALVAAGFGSGPWGGSVGTAAPPEPMLRKDFETDRELASARVYVIGLGYYKLYLNGERVGDHELDPAFTVYDKTGLYATYDVTDQVRDGENALGVTLGRGYYSMLNPDEWMTSPWHGEPKLKLQLDLTYTDGTTDRVVSDGSWRLADGPTTSESLWFGETYDARLEQPGWNDVGFDDSGWRSASQVPGIAGELRAQSFPPIKATEPLTPTAVTTPAPGTTVHDYGSPTSGWATVAVQGPAGAAVTITYGEKLKQDGTVDNVGGFGMQLQKYTYVLRGGGVEDFTPSYSYAGFRYVQVSAPAGVTVDSVTAERVHTAVPRTGDFDSSSDLFNRYHRAQAETILNNLHSVPTDTPMYEKRPYTADGFLMAPSAMASFDVQDFYASWMRSHKDDQTAEGNIGQTVPGTVGAKQVVDPIWTASFVLVSWDLYWYYGDTRPLSENYDAMRKWLDFFVDDIAETGYVYTGTSYADWLSPGHAMPPEGARLAGTAYLYETASKIADIARALGHDDDATELDELAATIADAFHAEFYDAARGGYYDDPAAGYRQTSNLLPLSLGIVPDEVRDTVVANLVADIEARGGHLNTGALGTRLILPVLTDTGHADLAYEVATNPTYPGWGYWFEELGATTMWEEWGAGSRSRQHAFMGTVDDWLYQRVAGIEPTAPGYTEVAIRPHPVGDLDRASAHVRSPLGRVASAWTRADDVFTLRVTIPVGATAKVSMPVRDSDEVAVPAGATLVEVRDGYATYTLGSGQHELRSGPNVVPDASSVSATPVSGVYGRARIVVATVTGTAPTGTVTVSERGRVLGRAAVSGGVARVTLGGTSTGAGTHTLTLSYGGDPANQPSSTTTTMRVAKAPTAVRARTWPVRVRPGTRPRLVVRVSAVGVRPTGAVRIKVGGTTLTRRVAADGTVRVRLPRQRPGVRKVRVTYVGTADIAASSTMVRLKVRR